MAVLKNFDSPSALLQNGQSRELLALNPVLQENGLALTPEDAEEILSARDLTLKNLGRIELDTQVTQEILRRLSSSPYITQTNLVNSVCELYETFQFIRGEVPEDISDENILDSVASCFENICHGSLALTAGKGAEKIIRQLRGEPDEDEAETDGEEED